MIKIIIVSDIKVYSDGLSKILSDSYPLEVIGVVNNFVDIIENIKQVVPDVIVLDMTMPDSFHIAKNVMKLSPNFKIIALGVSENEENIVECAEAGIAGYVGREASIDELNEAIICTQKGEFYCPARIAACVFKTIQRIAQKVTSGSSTASHYNYEKAFTVLTQREQQIIRLMADGQSNKKISYNLMIEVSTVKNHVHNIFVKLGVTNRTQAVSLLQRAAMSLTA